MKTVYEVWYKTDDGIISQITDEDGIAKEFSVFEVAKGSARKAKAEGVGEFKVETAWVIEKKAVYEC